MKTWRDHTGGRGAWQCGAAGAVAEKGSLPPRTVRTPEAPGGEDGTVK